MSTIKSLEQNNQVFKAAMQGKSGTRVINTEAFGAGEMLKISLTVKKPDAPGQQARAFLHLADARRMKEALNRGDFGDRKFGQSRENAKFFGQGGSVNRHKNNQLEAREMFIMYTPFEMKDGTQTPRNYPFIVQIKNGKGRKPDGQRDGLVVMDGKPEVDNQYYFTEGEFTEFLDSGIRAWERWKLIQELISQLGTSLTPLPKPQDTETSGEEAHRAHETEEDVVLDEDDL